MDKVTSMALEKGRKNNRLLIQPQYAPMPVGEQVAVLYCGTHALMAGIEIDQVPQFEKLFLERMRSSHEDVLAELSEGRFGEGVGGVLEKIASEVCAQIKA